MDRVWGQMIEAFSQDLVRRITGLSRRQLEYWDDTDVIKPSVAAWEGPAAPRLYSFTDLIKLKVAARMRRKLRPGQMRDLMRQLEARGFDEPFVNVSFGETSDGGQIVFLDPDLQPLSAHGREVGTIVETFGLPLKSLRDDLELDIGRATSRVEGQIGRTRGVHGGQLVVLGTRVPVAKIRALADAGWDENLILTGFPQLTSADVRAALAAPDVRSRTA